MLASALTENSFSHDDMADEYGEEHGSAIDSDADSAVEESASQGSRSSEAFPLGNDVSLMTLLSTKNTTIADEKCRLSEHPTVLDTVPSTSTASINYECNIEYATASSDSTRSTSQSERFGDEARTTGVTERNVESVSPWMRNAGRKKSHPVWDFFKDLRTPGMSFRFLITSQEA
ncbi:unnamed protein product [Toxocara canis]|uniref:Uncharacterized protein n=1 Tax=Toxocara canis TaxID=6265 RepID=A0A183TZA7_TOXCA|nr:unnamed protein product [Toxocara canis]